MIKMRGTWNGREEGYHEEVAVAGKRSGSIRIEVVLHREAAKPLGYRDHFELS
jgi:hypothetical protein